MMFSRISRAKRLLAWGSASYPTSRVSMMSRVEGQLGRKDDGGHISCCRGNIRRCAEQTTIVPLGTEWVRPQVICPLRRACA
eukprot:528724-Pyramimonas_sp.AAC.1